MIKVGALSYAKLIKALMDRPCTIAELAEETGLHYLTVCHYTVALHNEGAIHIALWEKDSRGRDAIKAYRLGEGRDARRVKMTQVERQRRTRAKRKAMEMLHMIGGGHEHKNVEAGETTV